MLKQVEQLDLFAALADPPVPAAQRPARQSEPVPAPLNGFYYEASSRKFVSFMHGRRHYEIPASRCRPPVFTREWMEKTKRERSI